MQGPVYETTSTLTPGTFRLLTDTCLTFLSFAQKLMRIAICKGHSSYITHIDFTADSRYLQSNCGAYELLFWDVQTGKQEKSASKMRDKQWATWTCTLGWPVQGIWPAEADGTDVNAVDRSSDQSTLVTADDFGQVKLFRYPCVSKVARAKTYPGHASHVANIRFTAGSSHVITAGGNDRCIFQYSHTPKS